MVGQEGVGQPVERRHPRVVGQLTAAAPQLRRNPDRLPRPPRVLRPRAERREESETRDERFRQRFAFRSGSDTANLRVNQLMEGGFNADQAQRIMQRESELRMEALYAQYEAARANEPFDLRFDSRDVLRQELGDID